LTPFTPQLYRRLVKLRHVKLLAALVFVSPFALSEATTSEGAICPLSDSQTQKSIDAFAKIAPTFNKEPRCLNCHGGVNPFIEGVAGDHSDPAAPQTEHGGGKVDKETDCESCHDDMAPRKGGGPSHWEMAGQPHFFLGKDAPTLCKQMRDVFNEAKEFIGHLTDDNGGSNFTGTAFMGNRGLNESEQGKDFRRQPPRYITAGGLVDFGNKWVAAYGGEFKGDVECGCEPIHYAIRMTSSTVVNFGPVHYKTDSEPVEVPITFADDGTFSGDATVKFNGAGTALLCSGQSTSSVKFHVSGKATEQFKHNSMHLVLENTSPEAGSFSGQCPGGSASNKGTTSKNVVLSFDMAGKLGEILDRPMPAPVAGVVSSMQLEIVKRD
jgi:hypothetical protein